MSGKTTRAFGIFLFVVIGASALILGVLSANKDIVGPMQQGQLAALQGATQAGDTSGLMAKDTDGDGLSDYDELNVYHTSPYIKDSDSDGIPDGKEVENGTDPNCPEGKDCGIPLPANNPQALNVNMGDVNAAQNDLNNLDSLFANLQNGNGNVPASDTAAVAAQIRALLKQEGVGDNILNAIDDQTLIQMYNESAASVENNNSNSSK
jgi:hypothetical protein